MNQYICNNCGKTFLAFPSCRTKKLKFCRYFCKKEFQKGKHHGGNTSKCIICNKKYYIKPYAIKQGRKCCSFECRKELQKTRTGSKSPNWKGGIWKTHLGGYIEELTPQLKGIAKRQLQHRKIMEEELGRPLIYEIKKGGIKEGVHHIDGNKRNNDIDNLELMSASDHIRLERLNYLMKNIL